MRLRRPNLSWWLRASILLSGFVAGILSRLSSFSSILHYWKWWLNFYAYLATLPYCLPMNLVTGTSYFSVLWPHLITGILGLIFLVRELRQTEQSQGEKVQPSLPVSRRHLLLASGTLLTFPAYYGWRVERTQLDVSRYDIVMPNLPESLVGLRIALLSDWHCGPYVPHDFLERCMKVVNREKPDLILLPGDFVLMKSQYFREAAQLVAQLRCQIPGGILATWGNHDHYHGVHIGRPLLEAAGAQVLSNQSLRLTAGRELTSNLDGAGLILGGADDLWLGDCDLAKTLKGAPEGVPRLVMAHNPDTAERQPDHRIDLMVSGHTHGGQLRLPLLGTPLVPSDFGDKYLHGIVQGPGYPVLLSRGIGVSGLPMRLGSPPEIAIITLKAHGQNEASPYSERV